jgi:hypothetical protein
LKSLTISALLLHSIILAGCAHTDNPFIFPKDKGLKSFLETTINPIQQAAINEVAKNIEQQKLKALDVYFDHKCQSMLLESLSNDFITELFIKRIHSTSSSQKKSIDVFSKFLNTEKGALFLSDYDSFIKKQIVQKHIEGNRDEKEINQALKRFFEFLHEYDDSGHLENGFGSVLYIQGQVLDYDLESEIDLIVKKNELDCSSSSPTPKAVKSNSPTTPSVK